MDDNHKRLITASARKYLGVYGVSVIPLGLQATEAMPEKERIDRAKRPQQPWTQWQDRQATPQEVASWGSENIGLVTGKISGVVVVDCESREDAEWFWRERGKTNTMVQTPRGFHLYFAWPGSAVPNAQRIENRYDVRGDGGYVVAPPSIVNGKKYRFVDNLSMRDPSELPQFNMRWRYPDGEPVASGQEQRRKVTDGVAYINTMRAVAGQCGHNTTWKAVQRLRDSGMSESEALAAMVDWNKTNCDPPWSTAELLHKVRGVYA